MQFLFEIFEFAPKEVKNSLTGFGGATKEQIATMVSILFPQLPSKNQELRNDLRIRPRYLVPVRPDLHELAAREMPGLQQGRVEPGARGAHLARQMQQDFALARLPAVLEQEQALPGAE